MMKKALFAVFLVLLMSSCMEVGFTRMGGGGPFFNARPSAESVQLFLTDADISGEYETLGLVNVRGWQAGSSWIISKLKEKAQEEGGNAIILRSINPKGLFAYSYGTGEAVVVRLKTKLPEGEIR
jgi:hypothetical protein